MTKGPEAFRTISEAADAVGVGPHVLRFWETRFSFIRPLKRAGGRRFYRPRDVAVLCEVRRLLHDEGYSIRSVQKLYREGGLKRAAGGAASSPTEVSNLTRHHLETALNDLNRARTRLQAAIDRPA
ncbi:MAG TPA: MerR family transcriptional regulator [Caulobacteraceae bacterium]|nr:MerR family transcriptional regulator [Caulobacteraceae bacterium]